MPIFEFVLFAILGWCTFAPQPGNKIVLMVVFVVLMVLWLVVGLSGFTIPSLHR